jgi:hypothetical protein
MVILALIAAHNPVAGVALDVERDRRDRNQQYTCRSVNIQDQKFIDSKCTRVKVLPTPFSAKTRTSPSDCS